MITVDKKEGHQLKISHILQETTNRQLDIFLFIPGDLELSSKIISEDEFFHNVIHGKRTYYSDFYHLPLVHSRLASRGDKNFSIEQYRLSLSLYAYQYALALEKTMRHLRDDKNERTREEIEDVIQLTSSILRRLRRNIPKDKKLRKYFENVDNYVSWFTEQQFLSMLAHIPRGQTYNAIKEPVIALCQEETAHRLKHEYNSEKARQDSTRMSNKMRLLRRLIEYPVTMQEQTSELGKTTRKMVTGFAAGFVMIFVTLMIIKARGVLGDITATFIVALSFIYAVREVFKDDLKSMLWRWVRKNKPRWRKQFFDPTSRMLVGRQLEWLEYTAYGQLSQSIRKLRKHKVSQREETVVHYKSQTRMATTKFLTGYDQTRESIILDLRLLATLMGKGSERVYRLSDDGQVTKESVEKRHLINLITRETDEDNSVRLQRWKVVINRSKIVEIEVVEKQRATLSPEEAAAMQQAVAQADKADKAAAEKAEKVEKEKADKERIEREKIEKEKHQQEMVHKEHGSQESIVPDAQSAAAVVSSAALDQPVDDSLSHLSQPQMADASINTSEDASMAVAMDWQNEMPKEKQAAPAQEARSQDLSSQETLSQDKAEQEKSASAALHQAAPNQDAQSEASSYDDKPEILAIEPEQSNAALAKLAQQRHRQKDNQESKDRSELKTDASSHKQNTQAPEDN
ncbi:hypothetical protein VST7929_01642 [Vibrio stylophorae]|uniref:Uncharacterized protein n=1 Tax=Vibrio stylophorae TaxID=659351 RepID=A0ABN8DUN8_9VIBR|nr:hypothetical protein VST7929_01642 [Vibrio stylophorae]